MGQPPPQGAAIVTRHRLTYIDMHPQPLERQERDPSPLALIAVAALLLVTLWVLILVLFTL